MDTKVEMTRPTIDDLEMLNPEELRGLLRFEVRKSSPDIQYIRDLFTVGCPIDLNDEFNSTPLHWLNNTWPLELLELFLSNGVDINARDKNGQTPMHQAVVKGDIRIVQFLISNGAKVNIRDLFFKNAMDLAITYQNLDIIQFIMSRELKMDISISCRSAT